MRYLIVLCVVLGGCMPSEPIQIGTNRYQIDRASAFKESSLRQANAFCAGRGATIDVIWDGPDKLMFFCLPPGHVVTTNTSSLPAPLVCTRVSDTMVCN